MSVVKTDTFVVVIDAYVPARFNVGQNLYIYKQSIREAATNWTLAVSDWYYEVRYLGSGIQCYKTLYVRNLLMFVIS